MIYSIYLLILDYKWHNTNKQTNVNHENTSNYNMHETPFSYYFLSVFHLVLSITVYFGLLQKWCVQNDKGAYGNKFVLLDDLNRMESDGKKHMN